MQAPSLYLPDDLVRDILLRLPVKSLLRFKCVSKSWLSLISNHKLAITHLNKTSKRSRRYGVIESKHSHRISVYSLDGSGSSGDLSSMIVEANGFSQAKILVRLDKDRSVMKNNRSGFVIWNPATRAQDDSTLEFLVLFF
ncbi:F-box/kelch-repeat protein At3g23880-like [Pistacia vera]|uniref:F-box/kelch-repeat protein At3g23880-like n=1 Tax=Pistacia vera TaxID=55513 RepID=UPI001262B62E|nr:F-box/kelch-repeat protein At3g23880-like [Pistacia vera]